jgi:hypothetical protein
MKQLKRIAAAALAAAALTATLGAAGASATTLEVGGKTTNASVLIKMSLKAGFSTVFRDTFGVSQKTCVKSEIEVDTNSPFTGVTVTGAIDKLTFEECDKPVTFHSKGTLHISHIPSTTNGTVTWSGAQYTTTSPFGYLNCVSGQGTHLGTLIGKASGHAELVINALFNCGISKKWIATYTVTSPTGLGVSA